MNNILSFVCLKNVLNQNCRGIEHIIIDGISQDQTLGIIKYYSNLHNHIRWISEEDSGQSDAMNKGIEMARGKIIGFLNADDFYEPGVISMMLERFKTLQEPTLLVGNCNVWDDEGKVSEINKPAKLKITDLLMGWNINPYPTNPSQYFYHKSLHKKIGPYNVDEHYTLDIDFLSRAVHAANVTYINQTLGNYRKIQGTKTVTDINNGQCNPRFLAILEKYRKRLPLP